MKYNILIITLIITLLSSCQKNDCSNQFNNDIIGEWVWTQWAGTIAGLEIENEDQNENLKLIISEMLYKEIQNDSIIFVSEYTIDNSKKIIKFISGREKRIELIDTKLIVGDLFPDGITIEYRKKCN